MCEPTLPRCFHRCTWFISNTLVTGAFREQSANVKAVEGTRFAGLMDEEDEDEDSEDDSDEVSDNDTGDGSNVDPITSRVDSLVANGCQVYYPVCSTPASVVDCYFLLIFFRWVIDCSWWMDAG